LIDKTRKTTALFAAMIIAMLAVGISYAMWDKTLYINGTVDTGDLCMEILSVASDDTGTDPGKDKDVASTTVTWTEQTVTITITNAYPCYYTYVHITAHNCGTIPVKLQSINVLAPAELTVTGSDSIGEQLEPCDNRDNTIYIHVEQSAAELATYKFTVEYYYVQWNEYTP
jgi:hypothetical protein